MTDAEASLIFYQIKTRLQEKTPVDSGNLRYTATKYETQGQGVGLITISLEEAPYFEFVNNHEILTFRRKLRDENKKKIDAWEYFTRRNRNYHYVENAMTDIVKDIAKELGAKVYWNGRLL